MRVKVEMIGFMYGEGISSRYMITIDLPNEKNSANSFRLCQQNLSDSYILPVAR